MAGKALPRLQASLSPPDLNVSDLLIPIAEFLHRSGLSKAQLLAEWRSAIQRCSGRKKGVKVVHIGFHELGVTVVSRWLRDPEYLNHVGRPDDLPIRGKRSFSSLLKSCRIERPAASVLSSLIRFGTVKKISPNRYRLVRRSINFAIPTYVPFEPNLEFLVDATRASTWGSTVAPKLPRLFWQNVASSSVPSRHTAAFLNFARDRGLMFMHEINDWLEAHEQLPLSNAKNKKAVKGTRRLGVGLFGVCNPK
jgi:Family of unknown function (DUF6502)